jgi:hypothetical protein
MMRLEQRGAVAFTSLSCLLSAPAEAADHLAGLSQVVLAPMGATDDPNMLANFVERDVPCFTCACAHAGHGRRQPGS